MVKILIKGKDDKINDLINLFVNVVLMVVVLGLSMGLGLIIEMGYDKNSYDSGFYDGLSAFCGNLSVGIKDGVYVCYDPSPVINDGVASFFENKERGVLSP